MQYLVDTYKCEWAETIKDPAKRAKFRHFINSGDADDSIELVDERGQRRPRDWQKTPVAPAIRDRRHLPLIHTQWVKVAKVSEVPAEGGARRLTSRQGEASAPRVWFERAPVRMLRPYLL